MLKSGAIVECTYSVPQYVSPINVVPKKEPGEFRLIVDLRDLNKCMKPLSFSHEDIRTVLQLA